MTAVPSQPWTPAEIADLTLSWQEFKAKYPSRTIDSFTSKKTRLLLAQQTSPIDFKDRRTVDLDQQDEYFANLVDLAEQKVEQDSKQIEVTLTIASELPIGIAFTGDWHIGQTGTNYKMLFADNDLIAQSPGVYIVGMGDYVHNAKAGTRAGNALYSAAFPNPMDQFALAFRELSKFKGQIIGLTRGCHLDWDLSMAGLDTLDDICKKLETVNLWHGGVVHVDLNGQLYHFGVRHKYKGESGINTTNAQRRFGDEYPETQALDVICLGHLHFNDLQKTSRRGGKITRLRSGSYYKVDEFGQKLAGYRGEAGVPLVILFPDSHRVLPFEGSDLPVALQILSLLRES